MAVDRGFWLRDQTAARLGAWLMDLASVSRTAAVSLVAVTGAEASSRRAEVVNVRLDARRLRVSAWTARNWDEAMAATFAMGLCDLDSKPSSTRLELRLDLEG